MSVVLLLLLVVFWLTFVLTLSWLALKGAAPSERPDILRAMAEVLRVSRWRR
jgi:hypothetical protein